MLLMWCWEEENALRSFTTTRYCRCRKTKSVALKEETVAGVPKITLVASRMVAAAPVRGVCTHRTYGERAAKVWSPSFKGRVSTTIRRKRLLAAAFKRT